MADRYWVGGTGNYNNSANWSASSGGGGGASVPTTSDNVFFDQAGPYTVTLNPGNNALNFTVSGANVSFALSSGPSLNVAGSMTLAASTVWNTASPPGRLFFTGTGSLTINTNGVQIGMPITFNGAGATWTLGGNFSIVSTAGNSSFNLVAGTVNTSASNYSITSPNMTVGGGTLTLNASTVTITTNTGFTYNSGTINAGTSTIALSTNVPTFSGGGQTYGTVSFTNTALYSATINGANTFSTLSFAARAASGLAFVSLGANQTINTSFTAQSGATDPSRRIFFRSTLAGTARTITSASNTIFGADFQDITAAGAASWTDSTRTNYWGNCKGNTGITFATGRTVYWNSSIFNPSWQDNGWSLLSGGSPATTNFPLVQDTAVINNAGTVNARLTLDLNYQIGTVDMSARTTAAEIILGGNDSTAAYGDIIAGTGISFVVGNQLFIAGRTTQTITTNGVTFGQRLQISTLGGTLQFGDNFTSANDILCNTGTLNTQNNNVTIAALDHTNTAFTLTLGSSTVTVYGSGWRLQGNATLNAGTSNIVLSSTSTTARSFAGGGYTYNKLTIGGATGTSTLTISGANTFSELASTKTVAHTIVFSANQTITTWSVTGTSGNVVTVNSNTANTARTLTVTNRTTGIDYLDVRDITANLTPVTFYAGANSRLRSNVLGVAAKAPASDEFIYVLASGTSWTVPANWNNVNNEIHLFAGGGGGASSRQSGTNRAGGGGGGGGGYTKVTNLTLTPSASVSYAIGSAGSGGSLGFNGNSGGNTTFNSGTYTTTGGGGGQAATTPSSTGGTAGTGSTFNGGVGGVGSTSTVSDTGNGGGGGAGAGGPLGAGRNGGTGFTANTQGNIAGGGGGGNGGGSVGGNASSGTPGTGGNNNAGVGGGIASSGFNGGGGAGAVGITSGFQGGGGIDISNAGIGGGGGGGGGADAAASIGALFGGGGGGGGIATNGAQFVGQTGGQGGIVIWYSTATAGGTGNMFMMFR